MNACNIATLAPPSLKEIINPGTDMDPYRDYMRNGGLVNKFLFTPNIRADEFQGPDCLGFSSAHPFDDPAVYHADAQDFIKGDPSDIHIPFWTAIPLEQPYLHTRGTAEIFMHAGTPIENRKMDVYSEAGVHFWMYNEDLLEKQRAFFDYWLKGEKNDITKQPPVRIQVRTGYASYF